MKSIREQLLLYAVTDRSWTGRQSLYEQVESALKGGVTMVQLREKEQDDDAFADRVAVFKRVIDPGSRRQEEGKTIHLEKKLRES